MASANPDVTDPSLDSPSPAPAPPPCHPTPTPPPPPPGVLRKLCAAEWRGAAAEGVGGTRSGRWREAAREDAREEVERVPEPLEELSAAAGCGAGGGGDSLVWGGGAWMFLRRGIGVYSQRQGEAAW